MRAWPILLLLVVGCSADKLRTACDKGDAAACDALSVDYANRATELCKSADGGSPTCARYPVIKSIPLDSPRSSSSGEIPTVFSVVLTVDGHTSVDGTQLANDDAVLDLAKAAQAKTPDLRAVIKADKDVSHGRVIHVLDLLKQAGISKIAFGVSAMPSAPSTP